MIESIISARYAEGLFRSARKANKLDEVEQDLKDLSLVLRPTGLLRVFESPQYSLEKKKNVALKIGAKFRSPLMKSFLLLLIKKSRIGFVDGILKHFDAYITEERGILRAMIQAARTLPQSIQDEVIGELKGITTKDIESEYSVEPGLIGGLTVRIGNRILDGSIRSRLEMLRKKMLSAEIN